MGIKTGVTRCLKRFILVFFPITNKHKYLSHVFEEVKGQTVKLFDSTTLSSDKMKTWLFKKNRIGFACLAVPLFISVYLK